MAKHSLEKQSKKSRTKFLIILFMIIIIGIMIYLYKNHNFEINTSNNSVDNSNKVDDDSNIKKEKESIEKELKSLFKALKSGESNKINELIDYNTLLKAIDKNLTELNEKDNLELSKALFGKIEWEVKEIEINGKMATAIVEVNNKNFINVITDWMKKLVDEKNKGKQVDKDMSISKLIEALNETEEMEKGTKTITLIKENESWKVQMDNELRDLVYPEIENINTVINNKIN